MQQHGRNLLMLQICHIICVKEGGGQIFQNIILLENTFLAIDY